MNVAIDLPDDIVQKLREKWGDVSRHTLETLAIEAYRSEVLTASQVRRMLGFETTVQLDGFLKQRGVFLDYNEDDLERDRDAHRRLRST